MSPPRIRTQIELTGERARALGELATAEGRSLADLMRREVEAVLRRRRRPGTGDAGADRDAFLAERREGAPQRPERGAG